MDKTAFFTMPSGLYVVSAAADGLRAGCVINTAVQVTSMPPRISVAVNTSPRALSHRPKRSR